MQQPPFLPLSRSEMLKLGWKELDVLLISGDAYIDHPSFATALLGRLLVSRGYRVGIAAQPRWDSPQDLLEWGRPRLFAGISAGALDSMVAHYTAFRKKRHDDAYTPGGEAGHRPNRATVVYTNLVKQAFPGLPVVLGGLEASLRRAAHYDFWSDSLRRPLLFDSKADILVYGMGEKPLLEIAARLREADSSSAHATLDAAPSAAHDTHSTLDAAPSVTNDAPSLKELLRNIRGTAIIDEVRPDDAEDLASFEDIEAHHELLMASTLQMERQIHCAAPSLVQAVGQRHLVINPPAQPLSTQEFDELYALPYRRAAHPSYSAPIPAEAMICFSITTHRGCGGGCSFCSLALHQGRRIASRSRASILNEVRELARHPRFKGSISDIGGPSANMWRCECQNSRPCRRVSCLTPEVCPFLREAQMEYVDLLRSAAQIPGIKHVRIASGIRHDWALHSRAALQAYIGEFTGGQLKIAPEHSEPNVLRLMRKPTLDSFEEFLRQFEACSMRCGKEQYVIPYLLSAFPGCTDSDMRRTAQWLAKRHWRPQQVQCFIPTPGTVATAMYWCGISPEGQPIHVAKSDAERLRQHAILIPAEPSSVNAKGHRHQQDTKFVNSRSERERRTAGSVTSRSERKRPQTANPSSSRPGKSHHSQRKH